MATLEYNFEENGLQELRSNLEDLAEETEDVGDRADDTASDLEDMADTDAAEDVSREMQDAQEAVNDVGEEAQEAAQRLQEEFGGASDQALEDLTGIQDRLEGLQDFDLDIGGGDVAADISGQIDGAGSALTGFGITLNALQNLKSGLNLESLEEDLEAEKAKQNVADLADEVRELEGRLEDMASDDAVSPKAIQDVQDELEDVKGDLEDATRRALRLDDALTLDGLDLDNIELDLPKVLGQTGPRDPYGGVEESAESAEEDVQGLGEEMSQLAEAAGLGGITDQLGNVASKARAAFMAFGPLRGSIIATTAAVGTLAPKMGQLARELQSAGANASRLPSEIQKVANAQELLTGRRDVEEVGEIFKEFNLRMREAQEGSKEAQEGFQRLGITMEQLGEMTPNEAFGLVIKRLRKASKEQRALTREQVLGGQAAERFALMTSLSAEELERLMNLANETSFADEQISRFAAMGREIDSIGQRFRKLGGELLGIFEPVISTLLKLFDQLLRGVTFVFDKIEDYVREVWGMLQNLDSQIFGTERRLEFSLGGEGTESEVPADEGETGSNPTQRFGDLMNSQARQIARIRQRAEEGLISEEEMLRQIVSARESTFKELQKIGQKAPDLFTEEFINFAVRQLKAAQRRLEEATAEPSAPGPDVSRIDQVTELGPSRLAGPSPGLQAPGLSQFESAAKAADSIGDINSLIKSLRANFDTAANKGAQLLVAKLQKAKEEMQKANDLAKNLSLRALDQLGGGIGDAIGGAFFKDRERVQRLKGRRRSIQQNLRQARRAGNLQQVRQLSKELSRVNSKLDKTESFFGRMGEAIQSFGNIAKQVLSQVISKLVRAAVIALVLSAVTGGSSASISGMSGFSSFGGFFKGALGGGIPGLAEGGIVTSPTMAMIGEGRDDEAVMPLSKLESMIQPATPSAQPASTSGAAPNVNVNVQTEARIEGSDLVIGVRKALNEEAAIGGPGTLSA